MTRPIVSVIIATYNRPELVTRAVESVRTQTFKDWELVLVNDGSSPEVTAQLESLSRLDERIKLYWKENGGIGKARAFGMRKISAKYVAFLDDDDCFLPDKLSKQVDFLEHHPDTDLVYSYVKVCGENRRLPEIYPDEPITDFAGLVKSCKIQTMAVLVRANVFQRWGGFRTDLGSCDDHEMWLRVALRGKIDFLPEIVGEYWWHRGNMSLNTNLRAFNESRIFKMLLANNEVSLKHKKMIRCEGASRNYLRASDALDRKAYWDAARFFCLSLSFDPWVGENISWSRIENRFYRVMKPYWAVCYSILAHLGKKMMPSECRSAGDPDV